LSETKISLEEQNVAIKPQISSTQNLTQISTKIFEQKGVKASIFCVWAFLKSEKISYKKRCIGQSQCGLHHDW